MLSGLLLFEQPVEVGEEINGHVILKKALSISEDLYLHSNENTFTIQLGSNASNVRNGRRFAYKIDNSYKDWVKTSEQNPNINFTSLRHGDYLLRVRMLNGDGTIADNETTLNIHISSPIWRTRWALLLYALALLAAGWWWHRRFLSRQQERMRLEQLCRETEKQQWMSEMRQQLLKEASEGKLTWERETEEEDSMKLNLIVADLIGFLKKTVEEFKVPEEKKTGITFNASERTLNMPFDTEELGRAINILLNNSINFTPAHCYIELIVEKKDNQAVIRVADNGVGIPEEAWDTMFAPHVGEATGTSLYDVKRIVEAHGGTISVEERQRGGTIFTITLPISQSDAEVEVEEAVIMDE